MLRDANVRGRLVSRSIIFTYYGCLRYRWVGGWVRKYLNAYWCLWLYGWLGWNYLNANWSVQGGRGLEKSYAYVIGPLCAFRVKKTQYASYVNKKYVYCVMTEQKIVKMTWSQYITKYYIYEIPCTRENLRVLRPLIKTIYAIEREQIIRWILTCINHIYKAK